jgi:hypothetical protein
MPLELFIQHHHRSVQLLEIENIRIYHREKWELEIDLHLQNCAKHLLYSFDSRCSTAVDSLAVRFSCA